MPKKINMKSVSKRFSFVSLLDDTFGMKSHFIRAIVVLWITTSLSLIVLNLMGWKELSISKIVIYILSIGIVTLVSSFSATCFKFGDCPRAAYLSASLGILIISTSALTLT